MVGERSLCAVLEAPTVVASLDDVAVMREAIEQGGGHLGVPDQRRLPLLLMGWYLR